jgi:hypothetical protein
VGFLRLSVPPKSVVKFVESTRTMSPARQPDGGIQISALNSGVACRGEGVGPRGIDPLTTQHAHRDVLRCGEFVVRQVGMEVERRDVVEQPRVVQVADRGQWCDLLGALDNGGTQAAGVVTGTSRAVIRERVYSGNRFLDLLAVRGTASSRPL